MSNPHATGPCASGVPDGCFYVVVDADRGQQPVLAAFADRDAGLGRQVVAAPAKTVELHGAAHAVIGYGAMLQADATARAEAPGEERAKLGGAAMGKCGPMGSR